MAQKRMFDKRVTDSDKFIDLPNSSKALYFMAGMEADDKGFFQPRRLQKMCGFTDDDFKILIAKGFFIAFESGVMVVTDWNKNNWLDSRRVTETEYIDELKMLKLINNKYELANTTESKCLAYAKPMLRENSIEENSIEENSIYNIPASEEKSSTAKSKHKYGEYNHVLLTDDEYNKLQNYYKNANELIKYLDEYIEMKGYKSKSHYLSIKKWVVDAIKNKKEPTKKNYQNYNQREYNNFDEFYSN
jgi:hypothetical protein